MNDEYIITKVQFNESSDSRLFSILGNINKRKRAYLVKKMLSEYLQIRDVLATYSNNFNSNEDEEYLAAEHNTLATMHTVKDDAPLAESMEYLLENLGNY